MVLKLTPEGIIYGEVKNESGEPVEGVTVRAQRWQVENGRKTLQNARDAATDDEGNFRPETGQNLEEDYRLDQSDSDRTFALGGILTGKYSLLAIEDGWDLEWTNATVLKPYLRKGQK